MDEGAKLFAGFDDIIHGHKKSESATLEINFAKIYPQSVPVCNRINCLKKNLAKVDKLVKRCREDEATFCLLLEAGLPNLMVESIGVFSEVSNLEGVAPLLEELLDTVNLISESGANGQAYMVKSVCGPYLDLLLGDFCSLSQKTEISRSLNIILETCPFAIKEILLKKMEIIEKLQRLFQLIVTVGDYEFQIGLLECVFRLVPRKVRAQYALKFIQRCFLDSFLDIRDANFETDCRVFLNEVNRAAGNNSRVYSVPCEKAIFGMRKLNKPNDDDYNEFWVDFNYGTRRITLFCEQDIMEVNSQNSQGELDLWETVSVSLGDVKCYSYTEHDNVGISTIELKKDINSLYPNMMQCSGKHFELFVQTKYNPRKALMTVFGSEKCTNRKASAVISPLLLNVQTDHYEENESPLGRRFVHEGPVTTLQDNSHESLKNLTPLRTKISVPCIPMSTPARSLCSQEQEEEHVSSAQNIQKKQHTRTDNKSKTSQTCQPCQPSKSQCKDSTFDAPKTPSDKYVRPKVKTPVVTIREGCSKKMKKKGKQDEQKTDTHDMPSDKREDDDVIPDSLPTSNHQHITTAVHQKSQRNACLSDSGIDLTEGDALRREKGDVLSKSQSKKEKNSCFGFTGDIDDDFKDKQISQGKNKLLKKKKQGKNKPTSEKDVSPICQEKENNSVIKLKEGNKIDNSVQQNYHEISRAAEISTPQSSDLPSSFEVNVIQESQYVSTETGIEGSSDVQDTGKHTDSLYSSKINTKSSMDVNTLQTTKEMSGKQKMKLSRKQKKKLIHPKDRVQNLNRNEESVTDESSVQSDVTKQLTEAPMKATRKKPSPSDIDMKNKPAMKENTTKKDSHHSMLKRSLSSPCLILKENAGKIRSMSKDNPTTKKESKCKEKTGLAKGVVPKVSSLSSDTEVEKEAVHKKKSLGKTSTSKQNAETSGSQKVEQEEAKEPQLMETRSQHCKRVLPSRKAKAKQIDVYKEEFSSSENVGNLFESPFSMADDDVYKDLPTESSQATKMSSYVKPKNTHRLLSQSGLYFPELSSNASPASDPYDFDMESEEQLYPQFQTNSNPAKATDTSDSNQTNKENGMKETNMKTSKFFKHRLEVGINISSETIATNYMKTWHQKLNKKGGKSGVLSQSYMSWKSVDKNIKSTKKEDISREKSGQKNNSKTKQQNYVEETSICSERRASRVNADIVKDTETIQNESTVSSRKKTKTPKFKLFNPELSVLLPTKDGNAELKNIYEEKNESLFQKKDQPEHRPKKGKAMPKNCDKKLEEQKRTFAADTPKKKMHGSKSRCKNNISETLESKSSDRYENGTSNAVVVENFSAICESLVEQSSLEIEDLDKKLNQCDVEPKTSLQQKVTECSDEEFRQHNCSIVNDLKSELSWIAKRSTAKRKKSQKTYKRKPIMKERKCRLADMDSEDEDRDEEDGNEDDNGGDSDDDIVLIRREEEDLILSQDSEASARSAKGELTKVSTLLHSAITPKLLQRGTPKIPSSKRRYSPLDVKFLATPKTPKTPSSFHWSDEEDRTESDTADVAITQQLEVYKEYSLPLKDHESVPKLRSRCADKMITSGPSSTVRPRRSALKRKYAHLEILDESESDGMLSSESDPHSDDERSFCPRKLFRKDLPEPASIDNSPIVQDEEENILKRLPSKKAETLVKSRLTPVPPRYPPYQQTEDESSTQYGELDLVMDLNSDRGINTGISTYIQSFGMDMQKQLKVKHQQLTELTRGALRNTQKLIYNIWTSESQDRGRALEHFNDKMLEELLSLEADVTALKNTEEKSLIFCQEQLQAMEKHKVSQEIRLRNLKLLHSTLDDNLKESEVKAQSQQHNLKQIMKKEMAALQKKLLLESNQHQISNVKRCLKSMLF
ncbi:synaptonemal complex protein 2-like [Haliotis cracherodii]|uniref:synaptonemal complex protein 2-like n=1 Tax=Haliotis cracherodii TaxID=6455 RepID=UPI0039E92719